MSCPASLGGPGFQPASPSGSGFQPDIAQRYECASGTARPIWALVCLFLSILTQLAHAHPFHETLTQFEHNAEAQSLELAIRIDAIDLDQMIERWLGERIDLERDPRAERSIELWLRERLSARLSTGERAAMTWIGHEFEGAFCWVYVQFEALAGAAWLDLAHLVLFDWHPQPTNHLVGVGVSKGQAATTTIEQPIARIRLAEQPRAWWWRLIDLAGEFWRAIRDRAADSGVVEGCCAVPLGRCPSPAHA